MSDQTPTEKNFKLPSLYNIMWYVIMAVVGTFIALKMIEGWTGKLSSEWGAMGWSVSLIVMFIAHGYRSLTKAIKDRASEIFAMMSMSVMVSQQIFGGLVHQVIHVPDFADKMKENAEAWDKLVGKPTIELKPHPDEMFDAKQLFVSQGESPD